MTASVHPFPARRAPSLDPLMSLVATDLNHVNSVILERMQSEVPLIPELAGHLIASGGKRMRHMLTLAAARLLDYAGARHHKQIGRAPVRTPVTNAQLVWRPL